jgi:hypothetical protein
VTAVFFSAPNLAASRGDKQWAGAKLRLWKRWTGGNVYGILWINKMPRTWGNDNRGVTCSRTSGLTILSHGINVAGNDMALLLVSILLFALHMASSRNCAPPGALPNAQFCSKFVRAFRNIQPVCKDHPHLGTSYAFVRT